MTTQLGFSNLDCFNKFERGFGLGIGPTGLPEKDFSLKLRFFQTIRL